MIPKIQDREYLSLTPINTQPDYAAFSLENTTIWNIPTSSIENESANISYDIFAKNLNANGTLTAIDTADEDPNLYISTKIAPIVESKLWLNGNLVEVSDVGIEDQVCNSVDDDLEEFSNDYKEFYRAKATESPDVALLSTANVVNFEPQNIIGYNTVSTTDFVYSPGAISEANEKLVVGEHAGQYIKLNKSTLVTAVKIHVVVYLKDLLRNSFWDSASDGSFTPISNAIFEIELGGHQSWLFSGTETVTSGAFIGGWTSMSQIYLSNFKLNLTTSTGPELPETVELLMNYSISRIYAEEEAETLIYEREHKLIKSVYIMFIHNNSASFMHKYHSGLVAADNKPLYEKITLKINQYLLNNVDTNDVAFDMMLGDNLEGEFVTSSIMNYKRRHSVIKINFTDEESQAMRLNTLSSDMYFEWSAVNEKTAAGVDANGACSIYVKFVYEVLLNIDNPAGLFSIE